MPPKLTSFYVQDASQGNIGPASEVTITNEHGVVFTKFTFMQFSGIEISRKVLAWKDSYINWRGLLPSSRKYQLISATYSSLETKRM